ALVKDYSKKMDVNYLYSNVFVFLLMSKNKKAENSVKIYATLVILRTYPITNRDVKLGLEYIVFSLLLLQIFSLLLLLISGSIEIQNILLLQALSLAVAYILSFWYVPKKVKDIFND
ncbi:hypothetical protein WAE34_11795, partial [Bacillus subtilis subsp. natto]|uniref:hypothetical protein n=1 Tax=Bacillus subtilis TaxID=1423 RepID=UPI003012C24B